MHEHEERDRKMITTQRKLNRLNNLTSAALLRFIRRNVTQRSINQNKHNLTRLVRWLNQQSVKPWTQFMQKGVRLTEDNVGTLLSLAGIKPYRGPVISRNRCSPKLQKTMGELTSRVQQLEGIIKRYPLTAGELSRLEAELDKLNKVLYDFVTNNKDQ